MPYRLRQLIQNPLGGCKRGLIDICSFHREKKGFFLYGSFKIMILQVATTIRGDGRYTRKIQRWFYALLKPIGISRETIDFGAYE